MLLLLSIRNHALPGSLKKTGRIFLKNQLIIHLVHLLMDSVRNNISMVLLTQSLKQEKIKRENNLTRKSMSQDSNLHENCSCYSCQQLNETEKTLHLKISETSRREFFKNAGKLGLGLGIGGGLISPI